MGPALNGNPKDKDYGMGRGMRDSVAECQELCQSRKACLYFGYQPLTKQCWLQASSFRKTEIPGWISGRKYCQGKLF